MNFATLGTVKLKMAAKLGASIHTFELPLSTPLNLPAQQASPPLASSLTI